MHGNTKLKFSDAKQAREIYNYKNITRKLYRTWHSVPALIRRRDDLPAKITHVPVVAVLVLDTPDDGRFRPKHVE